MSEQAPRRGNRRRRPKGAGAPSGDLWRPVPPVPEPEPIVPAADPTMMLRSLGAPPLAGQGAVAEHYLAFVVDRAARVAVALAAASGLLAPEEPEPDPDVL